MDCVEALAPEARKTVRTALSGAVRLPDATSVLIFGSYAKGTQGPESDFDVAVFFDVEESCLLDRYRRLVRLCSTAHIDIQAQVFCSSELENPCGIVEEIVKYGVEYREA